MLNVASPVRSRITPLLLAATLFTGVATAAYVAKRDYYHKQSDQFYYLSVADSIRTRGEFRERIDLDNTPPATATVGAALVMLPLSTLPLDGVFTWMSILLAVLRLTTVIPLHRLLRRLGASEDLTTAALLVYFSSFPITMWSVWPVNEGMSFVLSAWLLYFACCREGHAGMLGTLVTSLVAPLFRLHVFVVQIALIAHAQWTGDRRLRARSLGSLATSVLALGALRAALTFTQPGVAGYFKATPRDILVNLWVGVASAVTHLFVPETLTARLFGAHALPATAMIGGILLIAILHALVAVARRAGADRPVATVGLAVIIVAAVSLCFSGMIIARYFAPAYLWMIIGLLLAVERARPRLMRPFAGAMVALNIALLSAFAITPSTDPAYADLEETQRLAAAAAPTDAVYYDDAGFAVHERQVYGYFRRPSGPWFKHPRSGRFAVLTTEPARKTAELPGCRIDRHDGGYRLSLLNVECP